MLEEPAGESSGAAPVLPPGWTQEVSRSTGETYYRHVESGQTQWDVPTPADVKLPAGWEAVDSADTGQTYYVNSLTGEHQFDRPRAPAGARAAWTAPEATALLLTAQSPEADAPPFPPAAWRKSVVFCPPVR